MTTIQAKPVPGYLKPSEFEQATARVVYEPPLEVGTVIRMHRWGGDSSEEAASNETVEIVGFDEWEETEFNSQTGQREPTGRMIPYAYGLWDTEQPPHLGDWGQFQEYCEREGITDQDAFLATEAGKRWLTGGHKVGDRRCFELGRGLFHSALIGGRWIPVIHETVRTQVRPVLGWALENAAQTSYKGAEQAAGHRGIARDAKTGKLIRESDVERRRWSTTLDVRALAELDRISTETGEHRNEIVERLILAATAAAEPALAEPDITPDELTALIAKLCRQYGEAWPRGMASDLARRAGITKQSVSQRKKSALAALAQVAAEVG